MYVVCHESNQVHVFSDQKPFKDLTGERISVVEMQQPWDISACKVSRSLFISDRGRRCLWRVQMKNGEINQWKIHGKPNTLSINPSGELIVVVRRDNRYHLDTFSCLEVNQTQSIPLPRKINNVLHAVRSAKWRIIMSYSTDNLFGDICHITELSIDGKHFIRTFQILSFTSMDIDNWEPQHLSFDEFGNLFVVDFRHAKVYLLNPQSGDTKILAHRHQLVGPNRLCYIREQQQLLVGRVGYGWRPGLVSVLNLKTSDSHERAKQFG